MDDFNYCDKRLFCEKVSLVGVAESVGYVRGVLATI